MTGMRIMGPNREHFWKKKSKGKKSFRNLKEILKSKYNIIKKRNLKKS